MAISPQVAPQAYTRDTLAQAYAWLQNQPDSIKKMATTPDFLVGLYLRYQRHGDHGPYHQASPTLQEATSTPSQSFKADLKNLANELKQSTSAPTPVSVAPPAPTVATPMPQPQAAPAQSPKSPSVAIAAAQWNSTSPRVAQWAYPPQTSPTPSEAQQQLHLEELLDEKSMKMVQEVKSLLNLGSDVEACRALVSMGFERLKVLFSHR